MSWAKIEEVENGYLVSYAKSLAAKTKQRVCTNIDKVTESIKEIFQKSNEVTKTL